jgi:phosphoribosyl-AMP cyclohydrolase / phosphoribosyl-ATP pyrophosphohydrolase
MSSSELKFDDQGLIAAVAQDRLTGQVRMVAWMNREALDATLRSGFATFFSRSRGKLWTKGESSGNRLVVREVLADCDGDTLLVMVDPEGPSCHTGRQSCFFSVLDAERPAQESAPAEPFLQTLEAIVQNRESSTAAKSYTKSLLEAGPVKVAAKVREEAGELADALEGESDDRVASEGADVLYHLLVGLRSRGLSLRDVVGVLAERMGQSGHEEKAKR